MPDKNYGLEKILIFEKAVKELLFGIHNLRKLIVECIIDIIDSY